SNGEEYACTACLSQPAHSNSPPDGKISVAFVPGLIENRNHLRASLNAVRARVPVLSPRSSVRRSARSLVETHHFMNIPRKRADGFHMVSICSPDRHAEAFFGRKHHLCKASDHRLIELETEVAE